jgi:flagellar hook-associated protein 1 FlgK
MRNNTNVFGNESKYTIANLEVNQVVLDDVGKIPLTSKTGEEEFTKTEELLDLWGTDKLIFDPSTYAKENYETFYNSVIYDLALTGELMKDMTAGEKSMTEGLDSRRQEVAGVSSDEELTNLIRFQNAYNASSRYITAVNEMLEQLMNKLGG